MFYKNDPAAEANLKVSPWVLFVLNAKLSPEEYLSDSKWMVKAERKAEQE